MAWVRMLSFGQLLVTATTILIAFAAHEGDLHRASIGLAAASFALLLLAVQPVQRLFALQPWPRGVASNLVLRVGLLVVAWLGIYSVLPGWSALWSTPAAISLGLDVAITCIELGWKPRTAQWYRHLLLSRFHLGMVGALVATFFARSADTTDVVLPLFFWVHAWAATAVLTLWVAGQMQSADAGERLAAVASVVESEHRERAHWLHDDVCAELRLVSLTVQTASSTKDEIIRLLDDFDHRLRLRQLDELLGAGRVRIAEVLQPFIRHAQNAGIEISGVPDFEQAALTLSGTSARLAARAASVLTSNALSAGAKSVWFRVARDAGTVLLSVSDNGRGFQLADAPPGRGLWSLNQDLGEGGLEVHERTGGGSTVVARIPTVDKDSDRGFDTSGG